MPTSPGNRNLPCKEDAPWTQGSCKKPRLHAPSPHPPARFLFIHHSPLSLFALYPNNSQEKLLMRRAIKDCQGSPGAPEGRDDKRCRAPEEVKNNWLHQLAWLPECEQNWSKWGVWQIDKVKEMVNEEAVSFQGFAPIRQGSSHR